MLPLALKPRTLSLRESARADTLEIAGITDVEPRPQPAACLGVRA
jgi:hypothetical protein